MNFVHRNKLKTVKNDLNYDCSSRITVKNKTRKTGYV